MRNSVTDPFEFSEMDGDKKRLKVAFPFVWYSYREFTPPFKGEYYIVCDYIDVMTSAEWWTPRGFDLQDFGGSHFVNDENPNLDNEIQFFMWVPNPKQWTELKLTYNF